MVVVVRVETPAGPMHDVLVHKAGNKLHTDRSRDKGDDAGDNAKNYDFHRQNILHAFRGGYLLPRDLIPLSRCAILRA